MFKPVPCGTYSDVCFQNRKSDANKLLFRTNMKSEKNRKEIGTKPYQSEIKIAAPIGLREGIFLDGRKNLSAK